MNNLDLRTSIIYVLTFVIVVLLIILKKQDDANKNNALKEKLEKVKSEEQLKAHEVSPKSPQPKERGRIGIIIDDFGYRNDEVSDGFLELDARLTYAVIPGHAHSASFGEKAVSAGFEVIVHMPMENTGKTYGEEEFVLMTDMDKETIERRLKNALNQIPNAIGMNNHQGSKASADQNVMTNVAKVLKNKNLFYIDSRTTVETIGETTMEVFGVPTARRNIFLDNDNDEEKIVKQMQKLAEKAEKSGYAIGIGHVKPKTLFVLEEQIPILKKQGFKFEFVSRMLH